MIRLRERAHIYTHYCVFQWCSWRMSWCMAFPLRCLKSPSPKTSLFLLAKPRLKDKVRAGVFPSMAMPQHSAVTRLQRSSYRVPLKNLFNLSFPCFFGNDFMIFLLKNYFNLRISFLLFNITIRVFWKVWETEINKSKMNNSQNSFTRKITDLGGPNPLLYP